MKHKLSTILGLAILAMVLAASPAKAQTVAPGPYYADPSWDQTLACTTLANCPRFIVLSNMNSGAVLDRETGLVWEKSPSTSTLPWNGGTIHCAQLTVGNRKGWKLPTIQELASLVDPSAAGAPFLPAGHPFSNVQSSIYWSATSNFGSPGDFAWFVNFSSGNVDDTGDKFVGHFVWCVRGGQGVDPQ